MLAVVQVPQFRALLLGLPLSECIAQREDSLLGAGAFLVASGTAEHGVEPVLGDRVEERNGLQRVADAVGALGETSVGEVLLDAGHVQAQVVLRNHVVAEIQHLLQVVPGVDVQQCERQGSWPERLDGQMQQNRRVLATREQDDWALEFAGHLSEDVDGFGFECVEGVEPICIEMGASDGRRREVECHEACNPHSVLALPAQRPLRGSAPGAGLTVHGAHPMDGYPSSTRGLTRIECSSM